jgi:hypothetical protein
MQRRDLYLSSMLGLEWRIPLFRFCGACSDVFEIVLENIDKRLDVSSKTKVNKLKVE